MESQPAATSVQEFGRSSFRGPFLSLANPPPDATRDLPGFLGDSRVPAFQGASRVTAFLSGFSRKN
jgi:hypothetical protein